MALVVQLSASLATSFAAVATFEMKCLSCVKCSTELMDAHLCHCLVMVCLLLRLLVQHFCFLEVWRLPEGHGGLLKSVDVS